jgi:hypothetical protein
MECHLTVVPETHGNNLNYHGGVVFMYLMRSAINEFFNDKLNNNGKGLVNFALEVFKHSNKHFHDNYTIKSMFGVPIDSEDSVDKVKCQSNIGLRLAFTLS